MINSIGQYNINSSVLNINNEFSDTKNINKQQINDTISISSIRNTDNEIEMAFNTVMHGLNAGQSQDLADLHGGLNLDRVEELLSL